MKLLPLFLLTVPLDAAPAIERAPAVALSGLQFSLAASLFILWFGAREQRTFLWLGGYLTLSAANNLYRFGAGADSTLLVALLCAMLCETTAGALRVAARWWRLLLWPLSSIFFLLQLPYGLAGRGEAFVRPLVLATAAFIAWQALAGIWRSDVRLGAWALLVYVAVFAGSPVSIDVGGWLIYPMSIVSSLFGFVLLGSLLRRSQADRRERERLASDFAAARAAQRFFLSGAELRIGTTTLEAAYLPAQEVGGDFYQFVPLDNGAWLMIFGDVSGKGLKAAMVVSLLTGALRNRRTDAPAAILAELNRVAAQSLDRGFVTAIAVRGEADGHLHLASAGHPAPYSAGEELTLLAGLPLGLDPGASYTEHDWTLAPGEALAIVSDGVVEAENARRELFGFDRTREISMKSAREIAEAARAWGQNDDITVVTVRRNAA